MSIVVMSIQEQSLYRINISTNEKITLGTGKKDTVHVPELGDAQIKLCLKGDQLIVTGKKFSDFPEVSIPIDGKGYTVNERLQLIIYCIEYSERNNAKTVIPYQGMIKVGRSSDNQIILGDRQISRHHFVMHCEGGIVRIEDGYEGRKSTFGIYLNGKRVSKAMMKSGDVLDLVYVRIILRNSELFIENSEKPVKISGINNVNSNVSVASGKSRTYRRSPRTREMLPCDKIVLDKPPAKMHKFEKRRGLFVNLLSSGAMIGASVAMGSMSPALLAARAASLVSPVANMAMGKSQSKKDLKKYQEYEAARQKKYGEYIEAQRALIHQVVQKQQEILAQENPSPEDCINVVQEMKRSLWERRPIDSDFLNVRIGMGYEKLCVPVEAPRDPGGFQMESDEIEELAKEIIEESRIVDHIPSRVNFREYSTIGILGERRKVVGLVWNMLIAMTTAHFYEDVRIIGFFDEEEKELWNSIRWLPHIWDEDRQTRFLVFSGDEKNKIEKIIEIFHELLSHRGNGEENTGLREPHYVFILGSRKLMENTSLLKDLVSERCLGGVTTLFAYYLEGMNSQQQFTYLPEQCRFIIDTDDPYGSCAYDVRQINHRFMFTPDEIYPAKKIDNFCRMMASIEYESSVGKLELPNGISFFQGMNVSRIQELDAWKHWSSGMANKSLAVPMAVMRNGKPFYLDVVNHGPHGLVAGMTSSGKSGLLTSWLLSVAVHFHPYDVSFLIIDYKGGGLANTLEGLPHMVGKITNIGENIERSMASLKSELVRRQQIFADVGVNKISDYIEGYHSGKYQEPMPRLLIVADEFRELKAQEPEFLKSLVSVATIGASLGVHLVLATQNPSGVVDDQIRANSNFQICLKVQSPAASRDVITHTEAAQITQAGRAYVRVGYDEVFELVQSYWCDAPYLGENVKASEAGNLVRIVETNGERIKSVLEEKTRFKSDITELQMVSKYLSAIAKEHGLVKMPCPWLPELPRTLHLSDLQVQAKGFDGRGWEEPLSWFQVPIGMYDRPDVQKQGVQMLNFDEEGHYGIYGAPGTGKTTMLMTVLAAIGKWYSPRDAKIYILDFGSNIMKKFEKMPHVVGVALSHEDERVNKIAEVIEKALDERRDAFAEYGISSLKAYRNHVSRKYPAIILAIDNIVPIFEMYPNYEKFLSRIVAEAASYGIYLVYTANSQNGIKYKILQNMRGAIAFELADKSDYTAIIGKPESLAALKIKGRGLFKTGNFPTKFQVAFYAEGESDVERGNHLKNIFEEMCCCWKEPKEVLIPVIPSRISPEILEGVYAEKELIPVGYGCSTAEPVFLNMKQSYRALITGKADCGKTKMLCSIAKLLSKKENENLIYIIDSHKKGLNNLRNISKSYAVVNDVEEVAKLLREVLQEMVSRQQAYQRAEKEDAEFDREVFVKIYPQICILVDDMNDFLEYAGDDNYTKLNAIASQKDSYGTILIGAVRQQDLRENQLDSLFNKMTSGQNALALSGFAQLYDFFQHDLGYEEKIKELSEGQGLLYQQGHCEKIKLPE